MTNGTYIQKVLEPVGGGYLTATYLETSEARLIYLIRAKDTQGVALTLTIDVASDRLFVWPATERGSRCFVFAVEESDTAKAAAESCIVVFEYPQSRSTIFGRNVYLCPEQMSTADRPFASSLKIDASTAR